MLRTIPANDGGLAQFFAEPVDNTPALQIGELVLGLVFGRHFGIAEDLINSPPAVDIWSCQQIRIQSVNTKIRLGRVRTMTSDALLRQDRPDGLAKVIQIGGGNGRR